MRGSSAAVLAHRHLCSRERGQAEKGCRTKTHHPFLSIYPVLGTLCRESCLGASYLALLGLSLSKGETRPVLSWLRLSGLL